MLPGFNHNIRYKDRVFHVQTEDTGLGLPFLVTQVFIGGHLVAIEKTSYSDVLDRKLDQDKRNEQIRARMQDQHKRLLKNLVKHAYDDKIALYFGDEPLPRAPPAVTAAVESIPRADTGMLAPTEKPSAGDPVVEAKTLPVANELPDQRHSPVSGIVAPLEPLAPAELDSQAAIDDDALFRVFDEELQKHVPWSPNNQQGELPPLDPEMFDPGDLVDTIPPESAQRGNKSITPSPPRPPPTDPPPRVHYSDRTSPDRTLRPASSPLPRDRRPKPPPEAATEVARKPPPVADTLIDFGLPAALKEQLGQAKAALEQARKKAQELAPPTSSRKSDPRVARFRMPRSPSPSPKAREQERETQIDLALRRKASSSRNNKQANDATAETLLDVDAGEIQDYIAKKKRERADSKSKDESWGDQVKDGKAKANGKPEAPASADANDSKRPNLLVVERSLDEVILSYLADEE